MNKLSEILKSHQCVEAEIARVGSVQTQTQADIATLLAETSLDGADAKLQAQLSILRTKAELCPVKIRQLETQLGELVAAITARLETAKQQCWSAIRTEQERLKAAATKALHPFFKTPDAAAEFVERHALEIEGFRHTYDFYSMIESLRSFNDGDPIKQTVQLIAAWAAFQSQLKS